MGTRSKRVDSYISKSAEFAQPILKELREIFHEASTDIEEDIKWGMPAFMYKGIVSNLAAFKNHVSLGFWKGKLMKDPNELFNDRKRTQITAIKLTNVDDIPLRHVLIAYINEAIELNEKGVKLPVRKKTARKTVKVPKFVADALKSHPEARKTFEGFSYTHQKDYIEWVAGAKREETRASRLATALEWMAEGKPRNWKYMKK